jgi:hypothetical protein
MKARTFLVVPGFLGVLLMVGCSLVAGCKSTPKIDWNSRIGSYTFDQAVTEMGPPDKTAKLTDGQTVAEWVKYSNTGFSFGVGTGYSGGNGAVGVGQSVNTGYNAKVLRLVFNPDNKLVSWSKNY